ncbi:glycosyltransferase family 2 protein [Shewanella sp. OMA3-2]|uniref:glycosyltransferase family 2 protein n=1 Tax=Shewanella sp. OMA3-2 TaxID=2908650 RepID=UPI001F2DB733|nr:glycosyltransferase family 2 protein [Shewanella sp. OMA3-2]UJF23142.1 glycosyltransferase [Shewanella sp. OMA3-2]
MINHEVLSVRPKVSVCVVTYNHSKYLAKCLQSIIDQKTSFKFEIIVGEDCSTDDTKEILADFYSRYPHVIVPIYHSINVGGSENYLAVHKQAVGDYICHVDGDDYCLPGKLESQASYLDSNHDVNLVWHRMGILSATTGKIKYDNLNKSICSKKYTQSELMKYITIGLHSSVMYRSECRLNHSPSFPVLDYLANVEIIRDGYASFCNDEVYGVYRAGIGIASEGGTTKRIMGQTIEYLYEKYPRYKRELSCASLLILLLLLKSKKYRDLFFMLQINYKLLHVSSFYELLKNKEFILKLKLPSDSN